jgi:hypothetical protein
MTTAVPTPARRRRRRWPALLTAALAFAAVLPGVWVYRDWADRRALAEVVEELDRTDPGWRFAEIRAARKTPPDDQNAAVQMQKVFRALGARTFNLGMAEEKQFENLPPAAQLNEQQIDILRERLGKAAAALAEARKLRDMDAGRHTIVWTEAVWDTVVEPLQQTQNACHLLSLDAALHLQDGDENAALDDCRCMLALARSIGDEPCFIAALIRIADTEMAIDVVRRVLAQSEPAPDKIAGLQAVLERELGQPDLRTTLRGVRAGEYEMAQALRTGKLQYRIYRGLIGSNTQPESRLHTFLYDRLPGAIPIDQAGYLRLTSRLVDLAAEPEEAREEMARAIQDEASRREVLPEGIMIPYDHLFRTHNRGQASLRCAVAAVAAERYRRRHHRWPDTLDDLVKDGLLKTVFNDPFDGQPLRWRRFEQGPVVYSVGPNRKDDGGANIIQNTPPGDDIGFRLFDPPHRRQPPVPVQPLVKE